mmetsp:Transcript_45/g.66  ORF Transcript_45/g.66 Transcript_45/m.66 type:complete len:255 (-) Transcript_45:445-1209(-)
MVHVRTYTHRKENIAHKPKLLTPGMSTSAALANATTVDIDVRVIEEPACRNAIGIRSTAGVPLSTSRWKNSRTMIISSTLTPVTTNGEIKHRVLASIPHHPIIPKLKAMDRIMIRRADIPRVERDVTRERVKREPASTKTIARIDNAKRKESFPMRRVTSSSIDLEVVTKTSVLRVISSCAFQYISSMAEPINSTEVSKYSGAVLYVNGIALAVKREKLSSYSAPNKNILRGFLDSILEIRVPFDAEARMTSSS